MDKARVWTLRKTYFMVKTCSFLLYETSYCKLIIQLSDCRKTYGLCTHTSVLLSSLYFVKIRDCFENIFSLCLHTSYIILHLLMQYRRYGISYLLYFLLMYICKDLTGILYLDQCAKI